MRPSLLLKLHGLALPTHNSPLVVSRSSSHSFIQLPQSSRCPSAINLYMTSVLEASVLPTGGFGEHRLDAGRTALSGALAC